ncbi:UNVERIFIED_ORG: hypothetical protein QFZ59_001698 [Bacillus sp. B2I3]|nr:hypothetical protein [Bacillus sp. B2I3]
MVTTMKEINQFFERRQVRLGMNFGLSRMETLLTELGRPTQGAKVYSHCGVQRERIDTAIY